MAKGIGGVEEAYKDNAEKQIEESKNKGSDALAEAKNVMGDEEATELYNHIKSEETAKSILANKRYLYATEMQEHNSKVDKLGNEGLNLSNEFKVKKEEINNNPDLTTSGKAKKIESLYQDYNDRVKSIIDKQRNMILKHEEEYTEIAKQTLETIEKEASIRDFSETDMQYILYMLQNGSSEYLLEMLKEYDFNPFLIKMVNARDSKKPARITKKGTDPLAPNSSMRNPDKIEIEHPLKSLITKSNFISDGLRTAQGQRSLSELIPTSGVPSIDPWAQTENVSPIWRR